VAETIEDLVKWGQENQHLKGTPEYDAVGERFKRLRDGAGGGPPTAPTTETLPEITVKPNEPPPETGPVATPPQGAPAAPAAPGDPYSFYNTAARIGGSALTGIPDLAIALGNAGSRAGIFPETKIPYLGPMALNAVGAEPLPADASTTRQLLEGGASALLGGGGAAIARGIAAAPTALQAIRAALTRLTGSTVAPTVASHYGSQVGEAAGRAAGVDPETSALFGAILGGGAAGGAAPGRQSYIDWKYRGMGGPNAAATAAAARTEGVQLPASALGNDTIRMRENSYANRYGSSGFTQDRRMQARDQTGAALNDAIDARGSLNPTPTTGDIGAAVGDIARTNADDLRTRVSAPQEALAQQVGPGAIGDWQPVLDALRQAAGQTDPITARPLETRANAIEGRFPRDPQTGAILNTNATYNQLRDFRSGTRIAGEGMDPIPSRYAGDVEAAATREMRGTAVNQGVTPNMFDRTQERYAAAMGEGGPHEQLTGVAERAGTNAASGYNYLKQGEQDPARLRMLEATSQPQQRGQGPSPLDQTLGDYLRYIGNQTINSRNQGAPGPRQFATRIENMMPESLDVFGGAQRDRIERLALIARSLNAPTRQGGLGQTMGNINQGIPGALTAGEVGHSIGSAASAATGVPGGGTAGRVAGYSLGPIRRAIGGRTMQSPTALNALEGRPFQSDYSIADLAAAITAASAAASGPGGPPLAGPRR
jgi:hypothetical protein